MGADFVHLHTHSHYSLLDGVPSPVELVQQAAALGKIGRASCRERV